MSLADLGRGFAAVATVTVALLASCGGGSEPESAATQAAPIDWTQDDRVGILFVDCPGRGHFDEDTSDMLPVLIEKLQRSQRDVLRNVREDLAAAGEPALVELDRLVRRVYSDPHASPTLMNALAVVRLSTAADSAVAQELLRYCLGHPQETVRTAAVRALTDHAAPEAFDDLLALLQIATPAGRQDLVSALYRADRVRFEEAFAGWLDAGEFQDLWEPSARLTAAGADAATAERFAPRIVQVEDVRVRAFLLATQDKAPAVEGRLAILDGMLEADNGLLRSAALNALEFTSATGRIGEVLRSDADPLLRARAAGLLAARVPDEEAVDALRVGLFDDDDKIRETALSGLLSIADAGAVDTLLEMWGGGRRELGIATRAARDHWDAVPSLSKRAFGVLRERLEARAGEPLAQREALLQAIAQIPGPESTDYLLALSNSEVGAVAGLPAHRYLTMQASNTGPRGREALRASWRIEADEGRRFDLLWAGSLHHDDANREFLIEVLQAERSLPHERLWVAERLAREGPAQIAAPLLKRANLRIVDPQVRPAFECLLWRWYG